MSFLELRDLRDALAQEADHLAASGGILPPGHALAIQSLVGFLDSPDELTEASCRILLELAFMVEQSAPVRAPFPSNPIKTPLITLAILRRVALSNPDTVRAALNEFPPGRGMWSVIKRIVSS